MTDDKKSIDVYNVSGHPVSVPGGDLLPGVGASRPQSDQLTELVRVGAVREGQPSDDEKPWSERSAADVAEEFDARGLSVTGTGADGNVTKADRVRALERDDQRRPVA